MRRFIPARAGNGTRRRRRRPGRSVHPRACGERSTSEFWEHVEGNSSPRVRGTVPDDLDAAAPHRFIPARAGNGMASCSNCPPVTVHPRACGERFGSQPEVIDAFGSSPRVRGTGYRSGLYCRTERFIPARAGNGRRHVTFEMVAAVHPRACGERSWAVVSGPPSAGSSPRVRGTGFHPQQ